MNNNFFRNQKIIRFSFLILLSLFLVLLACFAYKGFFTRYLQDDYCYGSTIREHGFFKGVIYPYFNSTEYNGNRYSLTLFAGIFEILLNTKLQSLYPLILILTWLGACSFLIYGLLKKAEWNDTFLLSILNSSILITFTCYLAPDLYQSLYWRSSSLSYLPPIIFTLFVTALVFNQSQKKSISWSIYLITFFLSFLCAGFSEVGSVWAITIWGLILILSNSILKIKSKTVIFNRLIIIALSGAILGAILIAISPVNSSQLKGPDVNIATFSDLLNKSFRFGFDFLNDSLTGKWLPLCVLFLFGFAISQFLQNGNFSFIRWGKSAVIIVLCTYLISVACMLPSVLVRTAYPDPRALLVPHFTLIISIFSLGYFSGKLISFARFSFPNILLNLFVSILFFCLVLYSGRMIPLIINDVSPLQARALAWDQRQKNIFLEKTSGEINIIIPAFDNLDGITELQLDPNHWVNICAAHYYGVNSITAVENYNNVKPYFR